MKTTTATYSIQVTQPGGHLSFLKTMPTRPKHKRESNHRTVSYANGLKNNILNLHLTTFLFQTKMLFVSGKSPYLNLTYQVYEFFTSRYEIASDVEVFHTNPRYENALGFTEVNGDEQLIQVCNTQDEKEFVTTILHELVHVMQNEHGMIDDDMRERQAYNMEGVLYSQYCATC